MKYVNVKFLKNNDVGNSNFGELTSLKSYSFKCMYEDIKPGSICLVQVGNAGEFKLVVVEEVLDTVNPLATKYIIANLTTSINIFRELLEKLNKIENLKNLCDKRFKEVHTELAWQEAAKSDKVLAGMLKELVELYK